MDSAFQMAFAGDEDFDSACIGRLYFLIRREEAKAGRFDNSWLINQNGQMPEQPIITFTTAVEFRQWLALHHADHPGIWLKIAKKASGVPSVTYAEALDEALCVGWIDGQKKTFDETAFLQKFTKRGKRSVWSKINVGHVARLEKEGRMKPAGLAAVDAAKADGRWEAAYSGSKTAEIPEDFPTALEREPDAKAFFTTLNKTQRFGFVFRITTARKPETRRKRIAGFVAMLKRGEKLHGKSNEPLALRKRGALPKKSYEPNSQK